MNLNNKKDPSIEMMKVIMEERTNKMGNDLGIKNPKYSLPIKIAKGVFTGVFFAGGLTLGCCTSYTVANMLTQMINYEAIEQKALVYIAKGGVVGLGTLAGCGVADLMFETGDSCCQVIDLACDSVYMKKIEDAIGKQAESFERIDNRDEAEGEE